ncbi:MAG: hypothetical protein EOO46_11675 [Flavobacterium sp.]|nr:MAG: hypothetical protein EOO46_11675 [Flavobacterium sp.]
MELIKPKQISGEIMTLIEEADKKMIIVSPYYNISNWPKLLNPLNKLKTRKVDAEFYVREGEEASIREITKFGFTAIPIKRLHTKLYFNEREAIVSSMNLVSASDEHSLDIAMKTETKEEYNEIVEYYERYIKREVQQQPQQQHQPKQVYYDWKEELDRRLEETLRRNVYIRSFSDHIQIQAGNRYEAGIGTEFGNELFLSGILSNEEYQYAKANHVFKGNKMAIYLQEGGRRGSSYVYDMVCGRMSRLKSRSIHSLQLDEQELIIDTIHGFIVGVENFKKMKREVTFPPGV